jgi:putative transposase
VDCENNAVKLLRIGEIKIFFHKIFEGGLKTYMISKSFTGTYYLSILVEDGKKFPAKQMVSESTTIV